MAEVKGNNKNNTSTAPSSTTISSARTATTSSTGSTETTTWSAEREGQAHRRRRRRRIRLQREAGAEECSTGSSISIPARTSSSYPQSTSRGWDSVTSSRKYVAFGNKAEDKNDHIIISDKTDTFYYDRDGEGGKNQIAFARVDEEIIHNLSPLDPFTWILLLSLALT